MRKVYFFLSLIFITIKSSGQFPLTLVTYTQNFDGLGTGSSTVAGGDLSLISGPLNGWYFLEDLSNVNNDIIAGNGSLNQGDTYNFGSSADRTLGGLQSGNLNPTIGFYFKNTTGFTITSLTIGYTGEQWRLGTISRLDKMDFQYSQNAISLNSGNWIDADALDFTAPVTTIPTGQLDGNLPANRSVINAVVTGVFIPNNTNFFIRWTDLNAAGFEDGLGVDDLSLTAGINSSSTDYFRSVQSGSWTSISTWESSPNNSTWTTATAIPNSVANVISIRNGHTVSFSAFLPVDQAVIENGGILDFISGTLTIEDGSGDDIDVQSGAVFKLSPDNNPPMFMGTSTVNLQGSGILRIAATGLTTTPGAGVHAANYIYQHQSILEHTLSTPFGTVGVTYFPNVVAGVIPIFRITQNIGVFVGSLFPTIINGVFEANGNVTFTATGTKTFRNGIRGSGNINESSSGKFIINGATAELGGTGLLTVPTTGGLEIGSSSTVTMSSNKTITGNVSLLNSNSLIVLGNFNLTVTGTVGITLVSSFIKTNGTGKLTLRNVGSGLASKLFPIGLTTINPLFISSSPVADYSARIVEPITPPIYNDNYAVLRTWYITSSFTSPGATIGFGYSYPIDCGPLFINIGPNVQVGLNIGGTWNVHQSGLTPATFIFVPGTFIVTPSIPITAFTASGPEIPFVVANNGAILPLDCIITTRSRKMNNSGIISWDINSCAEVNSFEVQRSINGSAFQTIGRITPGIPLTYSYTDTALASGTNLYRIKVNRSTGAIKYSNTVAVIKDSKGLLITSIVPNPVQNEAILTLSIAKQGVVFFQLHSLSGGIVKQWQSNVVEGTNYITVSTGDLPAGVYHLSASGADARSVFRMVKQ